MDADPDVRKVAASSLPQLVWRFKGTKFEQNEASKNVPCPLILLFGLVDNESFRSSIGIKRLSPDKLPQVKRENLENAILKQFSMKDMDLDMEAAVGRFCRSLKLITDIDNEEVVCDVLQAMGSLACSLPPHAPACCTLLWVALDSLVHNAMRVRGVAYDVVCRIAASANLQPQQLIRAFKSTLFPRMISNCCATPTLINEVCDILDQDPPDFVRQALPQVLPQLITDQREDVLQQVALICDTTAYDLIAEFLHIILADFLLSRNMAWDQVDSYNAFLVRSATIQLFKFFGGHTTFYFFFIRANSFPILTW